MNRRDVMKAAAGAIVGGRAIVGEVGAKLARGSSLGQYEGMLHKGPSQVQAICEPDRLPNALATLFNDLHAEENRLYRRGQRQVGGFDPDLIDRKSCSTSHKVRTQFNRNEASRTTLDRINQKIKEFQNDPLNQIFR